MGRSAISTKFRRIIVLQYNTAARHECISEQKVGSMGWILERYFWTKSWLDRWVASMCCDRQDCGRPWGAVFDLELAARAFVLPFAKHREKYTVKNNRYDKVSAHFFRHPYTTFTFIQFWDSTTWSILFWDVKFPNLLPGCQVGNLTVFDLELTAETFVFFSIRQAPRTGRVMAQNTFARHVDVRRGFQLFYTIHQWTWGDVNSLEA